MPAAYCPRCSVPATPDYPDRPRGPQSIKHLAGCPERPEPQAEAGELQPGQRVLIYGGTAALVDRVEPDPTEHDTPFVVLHYTTGPDANGNPIPGRWPLPATQLLPLLP